MTVGEQLELLTDYAKKYRNEAEASLKRNKHMNDIKDDDVIDQRVVDAVLTDFINYIGARNCVDYALYTCDLDDNSTSPYKLDLHENKMTFNEIDSEKNKEAQKNKGFHC